jgi:hypothetical protein
MIRCSCGERMLVIPPAACSCYPDFCSRCLLCELHCDCTDEATIVPVVPDSRRDAGSSTARRVHSAPRPAVGAANVRVR